MPFCPECNSQKIWKDGLRYIQGQSIQRYLCRSCGYRFSENNYKECQTISSRQICVYEEKAKNLVAEQQEKVLQENKTNTKSNLVNFSLYLLKNGRSEPTIRTYTRRLKSLLRFCDLSNPEEVKEIIATKYSNKGTKQLTCYAYDSYLQFVGGKWTKPNYKPEHKQVFIPTEQELQIAINAGQKRNVLFSRFIYETGARVNEAERLEWTDINSEKCKITVKASKNGRSRTLKVTEDLIKLLNSLPKTQETVFSKSSLYRRNKTFHDRMKRLSEIHSNPRFTKIHYHTLRHCKALREYHRTRDILHVKRILGHKSINTTMVYVEIYQEIYSEDSPKQFITKIASTKQERCELINDGWDLVEKEGDDWYFKRPK